MELLDFKEMELAKILKKKEKEVESILDINKVHFLRCDGKQFKKFTKGLDFPFDYAYRKAMERTMLKLCENIQCSKIGYTQSDEITIMFENPIDEEKNHLMYGGRVEKICSVVASMTTLYFNNFFKEEMDKKYKELINSKTMDEYEDMQEILKEYEKIKKKFYTAVFDCRVFSLEKKDYLLPFIWRFLDCKKNAIQMISRSVFSHKELNGKSLKEMKDMLLEKGIMVNSFERKYLNGLITIKEDQTFYEGTTRECIRKKWVLKDTIKFLEQKVREL